MKYNLNVHHRRSIRLQSYDYSQQGLYFITICTQNKLCLFGKIEDGNMQLNVAGKMIQQQWLGLVHRFNTIKLHEFVVMPHVLQEKMCLGHRRLKWLESKNSLNS